MHGVAKASGVRCCVRRGLGARLRGTVGIAFVRNFRVRSVIGGARHDCFSHCNAGADVVQARMWCVVILGEARPDYFSQCNAGVNVVEARMWVEIPIEK